MNIKNLYFFVIIFLFNGKLLSQSFEKQYQIDSLINVNLRSNENIAYINNEGSIIFFNSSFNSNNIGGINDKNDVWYSISTSGKWEKPNNLSKVNSINNDILLGIEDDKLVVFTEGIIKYYNTNVNNIELLNESSIVGFNPFFDLITGSIYNNIILLGIESYGSYGVEDIYISKQITSSSWSRLSNIGSIINSKYQEISPYILNDDTLIFSSNRPSIYGSFNFYYSVNLDDNYRKWSEPILIDKFNSNASEKFISYNSNNKIFIISEEYNSLGYSNLKLLRRINKDDKFQIDFSINNTEDINGELYIYSDSSLIDFFKINTKSLIYNYKKNQNLIFSFKIKNFFQLDTLISINENKKVLLNLKEIKNNSRLILDNILFKRSSDEILQSFQKNLNNILHIFNNEKNISVLIEGHTDNSGDFNENLKLSKKRANVIRDYLIKNGINKKRIKTKGYGSLKPRYSNSSEETKRLNRRVEILIIDQ